LYLKIIFNKDFIFFLRCLEVEIDLAVNHVAEVAVNPAVNHVAEVAVNPAVNHAANHVAEVAANHDQVIQTLNDSSNYGTK
jgi:cellobiose-specific phosphotransferase system component IIB